MKGLLQKSHFKNKTLSKVIAMTSNIIENIEDISSISDVSYEDQWTDEEYDNSSESANEDDEDDEYDDQETNLRSQLSSHQEKLNNNCHDIMHFLYEISENDAITQGEYLTYTNKMKEIYISHKDSVNVLNDINNINSLNYVDQQIDLHIALYDNKQLRDENKKLKAKLKKCECEHESNSESNSDIESDSDNEV